MTEDVTRFLRGNKQLLKAKIWVKVIILPFQDTEIDFRYRHTQGGMKLNLHTLLFSFFGSLRIAETSSE